MIKRRVVLLLTVMTVALLVVASPAWAADPFIVNSTGDGGDDNPGNGTCAVDTLPVGFEPECTLRAAIEEANFTTAADLINFNIGGSGVQTISPMSPLPSITQPVTINGYSQPGASPNTKAVGTNAVLLIQLNGANHTSTGANPSLGLSIEASNSVVKGLVINRFGTGIGSRWELAETNTIEGNFIGTDPSGTRDRGNLFNGVSILFGSNNTVGGASLAARNLISGNGLGVYAGGKDTQVLGNYIGTDLTGTEPLGNEEDGVLLDHSFQTVGGDTAASANVIAFNGEDGVALGDSHPTSIAILRNAIFSNADLGIDLMDGATPNDGPGDADTGPNNLQNFPVLSSAKTTGLTATTIKGTLKSTKSTTFTIQFFSNPKGTKEEGKKFIGEKVVSDTEDDGIMPFTFKPPQKVKAGLFVTATATQSGIDETSEFSAPREVL